MDFYIVDVFAEEKYQGNPLAVFVADKELPTSEMQKIAREINFSETTFIQSTKQDNDGYDVRIFTPDVEIPFAGHPSIGTAYIIHTIMEGSRTNEVKLNLGVGQIPISIKGNYLEMEQKPPLFGEVIPNLLDVCQILMIKKTDIDARFPVQVVSTGLPSVIVPLRSLDALDRCKINHEPFAVFLKKVVKANILAFVPGENEDKKVIHVRVFVDDTGFAEDPATGSANGNLAGYISYHNYFGIEDFHYLVKQGFQMRRPSHLDVRVVKKTIYVGGKVQYIAKGEWQK